MNDYARYERHEAPLLEQLADLQAEHGIAAGARRMIWPASPADPYEASPLAAKALTDADNTEPAAIARAQPQPLSGPQAPVAPPLIPRPRAPFQALSVAALAAVRSLAGLTPFLAADPKDTR